MLIYYDHPSLIRLNFIILQNHLIAISNILFQLLIKKVPAHQCPLLLMSEITLHYTFQHSLQPPLYLLFHLQIDRFQQQLQIYCTLCLQGLLFAMTKIAVHLETLPMLNHTLSKSLMHSCNKLASNCDTTLRRQCPIFEDVLQLDCQLY